MDIKLSNLPTVTSAVSGDLFPFTQVSGPATKDITLANIKISLSLGNVENTAVSTWTGTASITTLGTITTGTWHGAAIADAYIASATTWNATTSALAGKEPALGNPSVDGYILSSLIDGTRSWIAPGGGGSTPTLAAVLAVGADGGAVDQTNLGSLSLADGKTMRFPVGSSPMTTDTPAGWINVIVGASSYQIPVYQ